MENYKKYRMSRPLKALIIFTIFVVLLILSLKHATVIAAPIFFAAIIAYMVNPIVDFFERKYHMNRAVGSALVIVLLVLIFGFLATILVPYAVDEIKTAAESFPKTLAKFNEKFKGISNYITQNYSQYVGNFDLMTKFEEMIRNQLTNLSNRIGDAFYSIYGMLGTAIYFVFIPIVAYYFIKDGKKIQKSFMSLIPHRYTGLAEYEFSRMERLLSSFIRGQSIVVIILITLYSIGLSIIGLPFAILIGVIAGVGDFIPYLGTIVGLFLSLIVGIGHFQSFDKLLLIFLVFLIVKGSENWFFYPKIVGKEVGLQFLFVLFAIVLFGNIFGFWGLLLAIPAAAGFKIYLVDWINYYKKSNFFNKE